MRRAKALLPAFVAAVSVWASACEAAPKAWAESRAAYSAGSLERERAGIDSTWTPADYLSLAEENNPGLRAVYYEWQAAEKKAAHAGTPPNPVVTYGHFLENVETRVGPQRWRVGLRQSYPWFGSLGASKDAARAAAEAGREKYRARRLRVAYEVSSAFAELYYIGRDLELTRENLRLLTFWESVVRAKYKVGQRNHPDVIRAQVELGVLEDRLLTLQERVRPAASALAAALGVPAGTSLPIPVLLEVDEVQLDEAAVLSSVRAANPNLGALRHEAGKAEAEVRLAGKTSYPTFSFGVDYIDTGESEFGGARDSGKDAWMLNVGLEVPLWFGRNRAVVAEAKAKRSEAEYRLADRGNRLAAAAERVVFEHNNALRKLHLYRDGLVPKAEESLNASYTAYQAGELDFLNVLDAQRWLLEFRLEQEKALATLVAKRGEIEMICGREVNELAK
jgi:outer membrane protein TolC